ncbi:MAG: TetR/AcrR family transcriptional regulator [Coriobacteriales bacterium]|jgi:AcrR family transcriptional regulator
MDRRQKRTRDAVFRAFEELAAQKHYSEITVADIVEKANVGRSTFYDNFETKDALLDELCEELEGHILEGMAPHGTDVHQESFGDSAEERISHLLYHLARSHSGIFAKLVAEGEPRFAVAFGRIATPLLEQSMPGKATGAPAELRRRVLVESLRETVAWWVMSGEKAKPESVARWYVEMLG